MHNYYVKVVPTSYVHMDGREENSHQFSVTTHQKDITKGRRFLSAWWHMLVIHSQCLWLLRTIWSKPFLNLSNLSNLHQRLLFPGMSGIPGFVVQYEFSPLMVRYEERRQWVLSASYLLLHVHVSCFTKLVSQFLGIWSRSWSRCVPSLEESSQSRSWLTPWSTILLGFLNESWAWISLANSFSSLRPILFPLFAGHVVCNGVSEYRCYFIFSWLVLFSAFASGAVVILRSNNCCLLFLLGKGLVCHPPVILLNNQSHGTVYRINYSLGLLLQF